MGLLRLQWMPSDTIRQHIADLEQEIDSLVTQVDQRQKEIDLMNGQLATLNAKRRTHLAALALLSKEDETEPQWRAGDRYKWSRFQHDFGTVIRIEDGIVHYRTDAGNELTASYANFERQAEKA